MTKWSNVIPMYTLHTYTCKFVWEHGKRIINILSLFRGSWIVQIEGYVGKQFTLRYKETYSNFTK